ncbi:MAG: DUF5678 domain-containing protein [Blastocatellia bacterium]|nr:DUF5678 domain-containing protein [Blastocatellia bacterium]
MTTERLNVVRKSSSGRIDQKKKREWLRQHRHEYEGEWVVLDGNRLVGHGDDPRPLVAQARAEGVSTPFVEFIRDESKPFMGGWL